MLLKSAEGLSQQLLCKRTQLAHELGEHESCLVFARQALSNYLDCKACLKVYLSHGEQIPPQDLPLSEEMVRAIEQAGGEYLALMTKLVGNSEHS